MYIDIDIYHYIHTYILSRAREGARDGDHNGQALVLLAGRARITIITVITVITMMYV